MLFSRNDNYNNNNNSNVYCKGGRYVFQIAGVSDRVNFALYLFIL